MLTREQTLANAKDYLYQFGKILDIDKVEVRNQAENYISKEYICQEFKHAKKSKKFKVRKRTVHFSHSLISYSEFG